MSYLVYRVIECNYVGITNNLHQRKIIHKSFFLNENSKEYIETLKKEISKNLSQFSK